MAQPTAALIAALRQTAHRLAGSATYQWSHSGHCNCGHLAQTITRHSAAELHQLALEKRGDWADKALDYCPTSGYPIDHIITAMLALGLTPQDLVHLERLTDRQVVATLPPPLKPLNYKRRQDVVLYLQAWANLLQQQWLALQPAQPLQLTAPAAQSFLSAALAPVQS